MTEFLLAVDTLALLSIQMTPAGTKPIMTSMNRSFIVKGLWDSGGRSLIC